VIARTRASPSRENPCSIPPFEDEVLPRLADVRGD
jgi:hypothetical protein